VSEKIQKILQQFSINEWKFQELKQEISAKYQR